jgi:hypothetical protein
MLRVDVSELELESAREDWDRGELRLPRLRRSDSRRVATLDRVLIALQRDLRRTVGQTYTLLELHAVYVSSDRWARDAAQRIAPGQSWAQDQTIVDAVFAQAARGALDWTPR